mmetsp:Transcript_6110/g.9362  ORF Transcript_6110/g.9362 Transcript_6110/m.9362 type:complete len:600 (+) Transcript_6110:37-1836(+)|eukprot:CAMPEP_0195307406 /NCGR_PEP_ID=MMETSP0707-20130614/37702_1 /TAXON_ID=33640 /ORGANISM="Asterionellopsis glacialis, Strain CCMP134" /LENGTH=599 /DNA_ID=CAMNT_0040371657 /DNA_START=151 /DNA_END=1950 /DNA_ORIENTATION=+
MTSSLSTSRTYEVRLAVYDLSRGMARTLSGQFLGPAHAIDIIPHTALIVYDREYYFGGGIQSTLPADFRNRMQLFPIEKTLGYTSVSQAEFENWCTAKMQSGEWNAAAYDLLHRNCNNFSHDAALHGLHLPKGVPDWILQVPQKFLSSPMGQTIRPMLEQMQVTGTANDNFDGATGVGVGDPFAAYANGPPTTPTTTPSSMAPTSTTTTTTTTTSTTNPWASIPAPTDTDYVNTETSSSNSTIPPNANVVKTPVLDSHNRPLLSSDTKAVGVCLSKLLENMTDHDTDHDTDQSMLKQISAILLTPPKENVAISLPILEGSCRAIWNHYLNADEHDIGTTMVFTLMLLRLIVLHPPPHDSDSVEEEEEQQKKEGHSSYFTKCIDWVETHLINDQDHNTSKSMSPAARSMLWCTASNVYGKDATYIKSVESVVEAAMVDLSPESQSRVEVRQAAAAFLYNVAHSQSQPCRRPSPANNEAMKPPPLPPPPPPLQDDELSDLTVSLICGALDGIREEKDETVLVRRLLIAGKLIRSSSNPNYTLEGGGKGVSSSPVQDLVVNLGFMDGLSSIIHATTPDDERHHRHQKQSTKLAKELQNLVEG